MKKWQCYFCGHVYDEAEGDADSGIAPGTRWEDVPEAWTCPGCGVGKTDFAMMDLG
jgi:rubredoxin